MKGKVIALMLLVGLTLGFVSWSAVVHHGGHISNENFKLERIGSARSVKLIIVYDNNPYDPRLKAAWGFACYINVEGTKILFDTGGDPKILLDNMEELNIPIEEIQIIVLSHIHGDHAGGLFGVIKKNNRVKVYLPASFPEDFKSKVKRFGCEVVEVAKPLKVCDGVMSTGELGARIKEQSLIINSSMGLIVITGCAHPGVVNIVKKAMELTGESVYLVVGGFHLGGFSKERIEAIVGQLRSLNVTKVAPCHCSGDLARGVFKDSFNANYVKAGVGKSLEIEDSTRYVAELFIVRRA